MNAGSFIARGPCSVRVAVASAAALFACGFVAIVVEEAAVDRVFRALFAKRRARVVVEIAAIENVCRLADALPAALLCRMQAILMDTLALHVGILQDSHSLAPSVSSALRFAATLPVAMPPQDSRSSA